MGCMGTGSPRLSRASFGPELAVLLQSCPGQRIDAIGGLADMSAPRLIRREKPIDREPGSWFILPHKRPRGRTDPAVGSARRMLAKRFRAAPFL